MSILAAFMVPHPPMIVPEVGRGSESQIEETTKAYEAVAKKIAALQPETIIISSPHAPMYSDYFHITNADKMKGSFDQFRAPQVKFQEFCDEDLLLELDRLAKEKDFPAGFLGERGKELDHGTMVPLYFIKKYYQDFRLIRIGLSGLPLPESYRMGLLIQKAVTNLDRRVVFVASGDLSHKLQTYGPYGFAEEGPLYDERIMEVCGKAQFDELFDFSENFCEKAAECGHRSFVIMAGVLDGMGVIPQKLSHQDITGVGYGICSFEVTGPDPARRFLEIYEEKQRKELEEKRRSEDDFVKLARLSLESYIQKHKRLDVSEALAGLQDSSKEELLARQAGAFVSIHKNGALRGCIGTFLPTQENLASEILHNAISASTEDPRFSPIRAHELPYLEISVDVLSVPEPVSSEKELDCKHYGVIVSSGRRRGLLLPDLEGVDTVEDQIDIARRKAGIPKGEKLTLQRFEVVRHT